MATYQEATIQQGTYEVRKWTVDFTNDLPTSVSVASGTAYHTPPSGSAAAVTVTTATPYVNAQLGPLTVIGVHYLDVVATFSNAEVSQVRIVFPVNYAAPTARSGMLTLIDTLRGYTDAGPNDYTIGGVAYWSDAQLQAVLDRHRQEFFETPIDPRGSTTGGTVSYYRYETGILNQESGTDIFKVADVGGTLYSGTAYSMDYIQGVVTWNSDTLGSAVYLSGRTYDLYATAAEVWRMKMANAAKMYDFSTDNHNLSRSQYMTHCKEMAAYYQGFAQPNTIEVYREDNVPWPQHYHHKN